MCVENIPKLYNPEDVRGCCLFKQFISRNATKYGLQIKTVRNGETCHALKAKGYRGNGEFSPPERIHAFVYFGLSPVKKVHNLTFDNFLSSYNLEQLLLKKPLKCWKTNQNFFNNN